MIEPHRLGVFAKEPLPGKVKTRLCPPLCAEEAARFYELCLHETLERTGAAGLEPVIFFSGDEEYFSRHFPDHSRFEQRGEDLGARIRNAFTDLFGLSSSPAALIGTDSPDLPLELISRSFEQLGGVEALCVPARDGGYVLVGLSRELPELFEQIPWSTAGVLAATRSRCQQQNLTWQELGEWEDVDDLESLRRLVLRSPWSLSARYASEMFAGVISARRSGNSRSLPGVQ